VDKVDKETMVKYEGEWRGERGIALNINSHEDMKVARYDFASIFSKNKLVLDLGCGSGYGTAILARKAWSVHGIDKSDKAIAFSKAHYDKGNVEWFIEDFPLIQKEKEKYGLVVCHEVIEHIEDDHLLIKEIKRVMTKDGVCVLTTPVQSAKPPAKWHFREYDRNQFRKLLESEFSEVVIFDFISSKHMAVCRI